MTSLFKMIKHLSKRGSQCILLFFSLKHMDIIHTLQFKSYKYITYFKWYLPVHFKNVKINVIYICGEDFIKQVGLKERI